MRIFDLGGGARKLAWLLLAIGTGANLSPVSAKIVHYPPGLIQASGSAFFFRDDTAVSGYQYELDFRISKRRATGEIWISHPTVFNAPEIHYQFRGKPSGTPVLTNQASPSTLPVTDGSIIVPSHYRAKIRMRSPEGIVLQGVFENSVNRVPSVKLGGALYARYRTHTRFHGTISDPSALGITTKTFTRTKTEYRLVSPPSD